MKIDPFYFTLITACCTFCAILAPRGTAADANPTESSCPSVADPVVRLCIFQNGLAYITRRFTVPGPGLYELATPPYPMRGTVNIDSTAQVDLYSSVREAPSSEAGRALRLKPIPYYDEDTAYLDTLVNALRNKEIILTRKAPDNAHSILSGILQGTRGNMLQLKTPKGVLFLPQSEILSIEAPSLNPDEPEMIQVPYMRLNVRGIGDQKRVDVRLCYLGKGLLWAPSYQVELLDGTHLRMQGQATVRNELEDLNSVECELLTGSPALPFAKSPDLVLPGLTIAGFLTSGEDRHSFMQSDDREDVLGTVWANDVSSSDTRTDSLRSFVNVEASAADISYKNIGTVNLKKNESLSIPLEFANSEYEPVVEWTPDAQDDYYDEPTADPRKAIDPAQILWNTLRFRNPYSFPLPAGPAAIRQKDRLQGQARLLFTPAGEYCSLRLSRALNVTTFIAEHELTENKQTISTEEKSGNVTRYSSRVQRDYETELVLKNLRTDPVKLIIRKKVQGVILNADLKPEKTRAVSQVGSTNECWELRWEITLPPQQEQTIRYTYRSLSN